MRRWSNESQTSCDRLWARKTKSRRDLRKWKKQEHKRPWMKIDISCQLHYQNKLTTNKLVHPYYQDKLTNVTFSHIWCLCLSFGYFASLMPQTCSKSSGKALNSSLPRNLLEQTFGEWGLGNRRHTQTGTNLSLNSVLYLFCLL